MKNKYYIYVATPVITLATLGVIVASTVSASNTVETVSPKQNLISAIAQKFNISPVEVQKIFDEQKSQMKVKMQEKFADKIKQAVSSGKLTQDQANKIIAKRADLESKEADFRVSLKGKTKSEIKSIVKSQMTELKQWADNNNVPVKYLMIGGPRGEKGHMKLGLGDLK